MIDRRNRILVILSDIDFSPQLVTILKVLQDRGANVKIILIGKKNLKIAEELVSRDWDSRNLKPRGKFGSVLNFILVSLEMFRFRPGTAFASGQFGTAIGMLSSRLLGIRQRVFIRHHSNFHQKYNMKFGMIVDRFSNNLSTSIVAVSSIVKDVLINDELVDPSKVVQISNGVDISSFRTRVAHSGITSRLKKETDLFHIGVISRLTDWKGVEYTATAFVRLVENYSNVQLHIVGAFADSYSNVKEILSKVDPTKYTLRSFESNIPQFLNSLNVFVHVPVGKSDEAFGIVYIEALAAGIPCIFTKSGILNDLEKPEQYTDIVAFKNSEDIYFHLESILKGTSSAKSTVPEIWLNQFELEVMADKYADLLLSKVTC
jgi:glycosyltransferase involved in cell wall biosynthesis